MTLPTPPYTYDDPRIIYDERCFAYDGGYDSVCLNLAPTRRFRGGKSTHSTDKKRPYVDIVVCGRLCTVNGDEYICANVDEGNESVISIKGEIECPKVEIIASQSDSVERDIVVTSIQAVTESKIRIGASPITSSLERNPGITIKTGKSNVGGIIIKAEPLIKPKKTNK